VRKATGAAAGEDEADLGTRQRRRSGTALRERAIRSEDEQRAEEQPYEWNKRALGFVHRNMQSELVFGCPPIIATLRVARTALTAAARAFVASTTIAVLAATASAEPIAYRIDRDVTEVEFVARALGFIEARGRFTDVRGSIVLDRDGGHGDVDFEIDARSVDSGWTLRDAFVRGEPMLDAARHPLIRFRSSRLTFVDGRLTRIDGMLTLRGVTRRVALNVGELVCDPPSAGGSNECAAHAATTIRRADFGMESYAPFVGEEVDIRFVVVARPIAETLTGR
jgi:polyisoprenoid-binding protein YceI